MAKCFIKPWRAVVVACVTAIAVSRRNSQPFRRSHISSENLASIASVALEVALVGRTTLSRSSCVARFSSFLR